MHETDATDDGSTDLSALWVETKEKLDAIDTDDPVAAGELGDEFAKEVAEAVHHDDASETVAEALLKQFSRHVGLKKAAVDNQFEDQLDRLAAEESHPDIDGDNSDESLSLTHLLKYSLAELVIYLPSDESAAPRYNWRFHNGLEVETKSEHLAPDSFCQAYHDASGGLRNARIPDIDGAWPEYIREFIKKLRSEDEKVTVVHVDGLRTQAVEDLKNVVENTPATTDLKTAAQQYRPFVVTPEANEVQVPSAVIERVLAEFETVSYNDLQIELDKRGHRTGNVRATQVGRGTNIRFWRLDRDWLDIEVEMTDDTDGTVGDIAGEGDE